MNTRRSMFLPFLWLAAGTGLQAAESPAQKPNIVFLIADDLATRLGCYGDKAAITPNLDRLAGEAVIFNRAYAQGSVCIPSRTSFMLGLNNRHAGADYFKRHPETMTLGRWFREHGYQTYSVGKIDHDESYTDPKAWDIRVPIKDCKRAAAPRHALELADEDQGRKRSTGLRFHVEENIESLDDHARTERSIQFLAHQRDPKRPFFAVVGFHSPHDPWEATRAMHDALDPSRFTLQWPSPANVSPLPPRALFDDPGFDMSPARQRELQRLYYATVTLLDREVGRILDQLRAQGLLENTVVVFTSDQGFHLGWRGQWHKHTLSEEVLRVPLIVRLPQGPRGAKASGIVELLDLFPTFCDLAGLPAPEKLDGKSFLPLLKDPEAKGKPGAFCSMPPGWGNGRTVRTLRWRLTERLDGSGELYDLHSDPLEYYNVVNRPENEPLVKRLHAMLEKEFGPMVKAVPARTAPAAGRPDLAVHTPPLAEGLTCLDLVRMTLDRYIAGAKGYGQTGYGCDGTDADLIPWKTPWASLDTLPSLLISACNYASGSGDLAWARRNYEALAAWGREMFAADHDGNGLIEYPGSGNFGDRPQRDRRPSNWWDTINFGHEDAFANALAYRAATMFAELATNLGHAEDARFFKEKAARLRAAYAPTFLDPKTGVLAGWKSRDGQLHNYWFTYVQGMAVTFGLLDDRTANGVMDRLLAKMRKAGYTRFELGLPGNLMPVKKGDYVDHEGPPEQHGIPRRDDGSDGFQFYENGGATGCWAYYAVKALYRLGRVEDARRMFHPMLRGYARGEFQGFGPNGMSRDWRDWKGGCHGYEGLLVDNYHALLAVLDDVNATHPVTTRPAARRPQKAKRLPSTISLPFRPAGLGEA